MVARSGRRFFWLTALVLSLLLVLVACSSTPTTEDGDVPGGDDSPLVVNMAVAPATLDPAWACGLPEVGFLQNFYVRLTQYGTKEGPDGTTEMDTNNIVPYFAESIDVSDNGLAYTFTLPEGATFPSGNPVDSEAVKYSFERTDEVGGCGVFFIYDGFLDPPLIESIETPDPTTVVFNLSRPDANALQAWAMPAASIVDSSVIEEQGGITAGEPSEFLSSDVAGSGPFLLEEYEPNRRAVLRANPDFFGDPPGADEIDVNWINTDPTLLLQARSGEADVTIGLTRQSVRNDLEGSEDVRIITNETTMAEQIQLPNTKEPWTDPLVREAVTYAVPYQDILDRVAFGYGTLFSGPFTPAFPQYNEELGQPIEFDMERAQELIDQSGLETPVEVEMLIPEGNTIEEQIATIVQGTWAELGINVNIRRLASADYAETLGSHKSQTHIRLDVPGVVDAGYFLAYDMRCDFSDNLTEVCIPEADKLLDEARVEQDDERRQELYDQITELWIDEYPKIMVYAEQSVTVLNERVTNYHFEHLVDMRTWSKR